MLSSSFKTKSDPTLAMIPHKMHRIHRYHYLVDVSFLALRIKLKDWYKPIESELGSFQ